MIRPDCRDHGSGPPTRGRLRRIGLVSVAGVTAAALAVEAADGFSTSHPASPATSTGRLANPPRRPR